MDNLTFAAETTAAIDAVRQGLELARRRTGSTEITRKKGRDLVTGTDVAVEIVARKTLSEASGLPVVGEEQGGQEPLDGSAYWLVDPICGTRNYASGIPMYCVNVALAEHGTVQAAVIGDGSTGEVLVAEAGRGAWALTGNGLRCLRTSDQSRTMAFDNNKAAGSRRARAAASVASVILADQWDFRALGSTLALPYLAAGRIAALTVFWTDLPVHCAAGTLLVTEAGGIVSDLDGNSWTTKSDSVVASANAAVHAELLDLLHSSALPRP